MSKFALIAATLLTACSAAATEIPLRNAGFEEPMLGNRIPGWSRTQHAGVGAYAVITDAKDAAHGSSSISMRRTTEQVYGLIMQRVEGNDFAGKQIELSSMLKTAEVGKLGWVMVMTFKNYGNILDQIRAEPVVGDTKWKEVVLGKVAPANTNMIEVGFMLLDGGTGWADHVRLRAIDAKDASSKSDSKPAVKPSPTAAINSKNAPKPEPAAPKTEKKSDMPNSEKKAG